MTTPRDLGLDTDEESGRPSDLKLEADGERLPEGARRELAVVQTRVLRKHAKTFTKLAK
jgi:hypothetical protein